MSDLDVAPDVDPGALPDPFAGWSVEVEPHDGEPRVLTLAFDSPALARRTECLVWVPDHYRATADPLPVCWFLHGTVAVERPAAFDRVAAELEDRGRQLPSLLRTGRDRVVVPATMGFDELLDDARFLVVAPDAGAPPWCRACNWVDGLRQHGVAAETHLHDEAIPLVEALFRVRTDRAGRAVTGHSMGGGGAAIQGFRHPDRFGFVGCSSGVLSLIDDHVSRRRLRWLFYNRGQGFRPLPADEIRYRNCNLLDLAANVIGSGLELVVVVGTGTPSGDESLPADVDYGIGSRADVTMETTQRRVNDEIAHRLTELGVPFTYVTRTGWHSIGASTFRDHFRDRMERVFADGVPEPVSFAYKAVDREFAAWGYDVHVSRPNAEFLHLLRARTDGRDLTLAGTGTVRVLTPPRFTPEATVTVTRTSGSVTPEVSRHVVGPDGRVTLELELGPIRTEDETRRAVAAGRFPFPHTRLELAD